MPRHPARRVWAAKARVAVARDVHPDVLRTVFDVADEAVPFFRRLALEAHSEAHGGSGAGPARTRSKVELKNPGRLDLSTAVQDAVLNFLRRVSTTRGKRTSSDWAGEGGAAGERAIDSAAAAPGGGVGAAAAQPPSRYAAVDDDEEEGAGGAGPVPDESPLASNKDVLTRIGFFEPDTGAGGAAEQDGQAGRVTKRQLLRRRLTGTRRGLMEDLNRRVAEQPAHVQHLLQTTNNLAALLRTDVPNVVFTGGPSTEVVPVRVSREFDPGAPHITEALSMLAGMSETLLESSRNLQTMSDDLAHQTRRNEELRDALARTGTARQLGDDDDFLRGSDDSGGGGCGGGLGGGGGLNKPAGPEPGRH
ncbi:hypothetical protein I4F81_004564 [Pyropia yezoensis]|uniref:Uncharacterized protein n=1 Tax=Pyropia yezoensis TaxID=2788 RepID=A0ACC3BWJ9_PYRYE|nr:hypothetical protein I4F81_004564 [Neopyropia yezoensis]